MKLLFYSLLLLFVNGLNAQFDFINVLPELEGNDLIQKLVEDYKPVTVLDYSTARDTLYKVIYNENDTVYGVYTHYGVYLPDNVDPSTYLYKNGSPSGINAEHTYPRSKGAADGNAKSDMHHLYPSKINVNSDRGSLPFNEIDDNQTQDWYYGQLILHTIPTQNIDEYSERISQYFEPRESHKGNVARAIFYFYSIYHEQALNADPDFFDIQKKVLCDWHFQDPVDSLEWARTWLIAKYQDGKPNPFVLDCSLASRTYCDFLSDGCRRVSNKDILNSNDIMLKIFPNPASEFIKVKFINTGFNKIEIEVLNILGKKVKSFSCFEDGSEISQFEIEISDLNKGIYVLKMKSDNKEKFLNISKVFIIK
ncbi:MAG TPA: T9SS type A sorting domain-containing protein [Bacteroidetes bacterium]|nr:T9SS type A sorting domain-containing protein [Bacteroidota bacterium]